MLRTSVQRRAAWPCSRHVVANNRFLSSTNDEKVGDKASSGISGAIKAAATILGASVVLGGGYYFYSTSRENDSSSVQTRNAAVDAPSFERKQPKVNAIQAQLAKQQEIKIVNFQGVTEIQTAWINSNDPMEDRHSSFTLGANGVLVGVFDGHSGTETSTVASAFLSGYIARELGAADESEDNIASALKNAYVAFDHDLTDTVPELAIKTGINQIINDFCRPAFAGCVTVNALIHPKGIFVANTGDCRAVLGIETSSGMGAVELSQDQTGDTPSEIYRIRSEHPGEEDTCVMRGRILGGLQPSRAFGDSSYKWSTERLQAINARVPKRSLTPPYVTALPQVTFQAHSTSNKFLILATDGLWDVISSELAVKKVFQYLHEGASPMSAAAKLVNFALEQYAAEGGFTSVEHLLSVKAPESRRHRDDITCSVVMLDVKDKPPIDPKDAAELPAAVEASQLLVQLPTPPTASLPELFKRVTQQQQQQQEQQDVSNEERG